MNLLDWILVVLLVLGAFQGLRRGLVKSVMGLAGLVVGLILASTCYRPLAAYLETHYSTISRMAQGLEPHLPLAAPVAAASVQDPSTLAGAVQSIGLPPFLSDYLSSAAGSGAALPAGTTVGQAISTLLASSIVGMLCFAGIFFAVEIAAWLLSGVISGAVALTPLGFMDHLLGLVAGAATTAAGLTILVGALGLLSTMPAFAFLAPALEESTLAPTFLVFFRLMLPKAPSWFGLG